MPGCKQKQKPAASFVYGSNNVDTECNDVLQTFWRLAKNQDQLEFFFQCRDSDEKFAIMIAHYKEHRAKVQAGDVPLNTKCLIAVLKEHVHTISQIELSDGGG